MPTQSGRIDLEVDMQGDGVAYGFVTLSNLQEAAVIAPGFGNIGPAVILFKAAILYASGTPTFTAQSLFRQPGTKYSYLYRVIPQGILCCMLGENQFLFSGLVRNDIFSGVNQPSFGALFDPVIPITSKAIIFDQIFFYGGTFEIPHPLVRKQECGFEFEPYWAYFYDDNDSFAIINGARPGSTGIKVAQLQLGATLSGDRHGLINMPFWTATTSQSSRLPLRYEGWVSANTWRAMPFFEIIAVLDELAGVERFRFQFGIDAGELKGRIVRPDGSVAAQGSVATSMNNNDWLHFQLDLKYPTSGVLRATLRGARNAQPFVLVGTVDLSTRTDARVSHSVRIQPCGAENGGTAQGGDTFLFDDLSVEVAP
jgi:hypothetical protein